MKRLIEEIGELNSPKARRAAKELRPSLRPGPVDGASAALAAGAGATEALVVATQDRARMAAWPSCPFKQSSRT